MRWTTKSIRLQTDFCILLGAADSSNGCSNNPNACQQICLPTPGGMFSCACASGFKLSPDHRSCSPYNSFIVVSKLSAIRGFSLELSDHAEAMVPVAGQGKVCFQLVPAPMWFINFSSTEFSGGEGLSNPELSQVLSSGLWWRI